MAIIARTHPLLDIPVAPKTPKPQTTTTKSGTTTTKSGGTKTTTPAPSLTTSPTTTTGLRVLSEEDFWREVRDMARFSSDPRLRDEANRMLREQLAQGNEVLQRVLGVPATGGLNAFMGGVQAASRPVGAEDAVRSALRAIRDLIPRVNIPTFEEAHAEIAAALAPIAQQAQRQAQQYYEDLARRLQAQQALAGTTGSDVALRQLRALAEEQARAVSDIGERFSALAAEHARNLIGQQLGALQTLSEARQRAVETATRMMDELVRARLAPLQAANLLLDVARLQEAARQANLPYQYPTANALLPYAQPTVFELLQWLANMNALTGGNLAGLGLTL